MAGPVGGLRKHPHGRVDQLEDRYLGMVEAPSSNLGTSTSLLLIENDGVERAPKPFFCPMPRFLARRVPHSIDLSTLLFPANSAHGTVRTTGCPSTVRRTIADFTALTALSGTATMATTSNQRCSTTIARPSHSDECT
jgi:hypothetical protein